MIIREGDILEIRSGIIAHCVNTMGVVGGLARAIAGVHPWACTHYRDYCRSLGEKTLGDCLISETNHKGLFVAHLFSQSSIGTDRQHTQYAALEQALGKLMKKRDNRQVYIPHGMACGLGGGDWKIVLPMIERYLPSAVVLKKD